MDNIDYKEKLDNIREELDNIKEGLVSKPATAVARARNSYVGVNGNIGFSFAKNGEPTKKKNCKFDVKLDMFEAAAVAACAVGAAFALYQAVKFIGKLELLHDLSESKEDDD